MSHFLLGARPESPDPGWVLTAGFTKPMREAAAFATAAPVSARLRERLVDPAVKRTGSLDAYRVSARVHGRALGTSRHPSLPDLLRHASGHRDIRTLGY